MKHLPRKWYVIILIMLAVSFTYAAEPEKPGNGQNNTAKPRNQAPGKKKTPTPEKPETPEIKIPETTPRVEYTPEELEKWKSDPLEKKYIDKILKKADKLLEAELFVPEQEGDWIFYYRCSKCDVTLKPKTPGNIKEHVCPKCGKVYTDKKVVGGYVTRCNNRLNDQCRALALAYALSKKKKYAEPVKKALLKLAEVYPTLERHDRWGRRGLFAVVGGRRYSQHLSEGIGAMDMARAYDLIADSLSDEEKKTICDEFLGATVREIRTFHHLGVAGGKTNHTAWFNAAYAVVGLAIGDEKLIRDAFHGRFGLNWHLDVGVTGDGLWWEGTISYHRYAMQAMVESLDAGRRVGVDFSGNKLLKSLWTGPLKIAYPDGSIPATNDSNPANINNFKKLYQWGADYFNEPLFKSFAEKAPTEREQPESENLSDIGMATLRIGKGASAACAMLDYGVHGGGHGHPDKLNLMFYSLGHEFLLDPGRISYSVPEFKTWCRQTLSHNTVVIGGRSQNPADGKLVFFKKEEDHTACLARVDSAYPGYSLRRFVLLGEEFMVDAYLVKGDKKATIDWIIHSRGELETTAGTDKGKANLGKKNGYQRLEGLEKRKTGDTGVFDFKIKGGKYMRAHLLDDSKSEVYTGMGIGTKLKERVPFVLRRREASTTVFVTVYDFSGDGSAVGSAEVELLGDKASPSGVGLEIKPKRGTRSLVAINFGDTAELKYKGKKVEEYLYGE